jgi:hypothetical protein
MNQQSPQNFLTVMQTADVLEFATRLQVDGEVLDIQSLADPNNLVILRSIDVLDLAAGAQIDGWSWADITNCHAA